MAKVGRRLIVGIAWVLASVLLLCVLPANLIEMGIDHFEHQGTRIPDEFMMGYSVVGFLSLAIVTCVVAVMALRGKLPGTRLPDPDDAEPPTNH